MSLSQSIRSFFLKEDFDFTSPYISLFNFHPQLRVFFAAMGVFSNNQDSRLRFIWPILCISLSIMAIVLEMIFVYHGISVKDYSFASECFCYLVLVGVIMVVYPAILRNKDNILQLLQDMNADFLYICSLGSNYRAHFLKGQLLIYKLCYAWLLFTMAIAAAYIGATLVPLLYMSLFAEQNEYAVRPLMFPMWLPEDDPYRTPNYEIFLFLQLSFCFIFIQTFCVYVYIQFHVLLHYYILMDMIIMDLGVIFDGLDETVTELPRAEPSRVEVKLALNKRMGRIVRWHLSTFKPCVVFYVSVLLFHQSYLYRASFGRVYYYRSVDIVSSVLGPPLVYQVMFTSLAVCSMAYQIADKLDQGKLNILFAMLLTATCVQLWIPCYLGTKLRNKGFEVGDACWTCGWHETPLGRMLRTEMIILILRTQQPLTISFPGLPQVQLETFSSIMSTAYSYFNMLRQYNTNE